MSLQKPNQEDQRKIHAEINQIINQRFLLITIAITVFGFATTWMLPEKIPNKNDPIGGLACTGAIIFSIILFVLYFVSHNLKNTQRIFSTYLLVTKASGWEQDWKEFREEKYFAYRKPQTIVFLILNAVITAFPFILAFIYSLKFEPIIGLLACGITGSFIELLILLMGFCDLFDSENKTESRWERLNRINTSSSDD